MFKIKILIVLHVILNSFTSYAGHETGNGADVHLSRYLLAQNIAKVTFNRLSKDKINELFSDTKLRKLVSENYKKWPIVISNINFITVNGSIFEFGNKKAALNVENSNDVKISKAYFDNYELSFREVLINIIHEAGHKLGIRNHDHLDKIGATLATKVYEYSINKKNWVTFLKPKSQLKSSFDQRLKKVGEEYLIRGEGICLAKVLYGFTRYSLKNSNLSEMFRYMSMAILGLNVKKYFPNCPGGFLNFQNSVVNRFIKELIIYSNTITKNDSLSLVKYGMAKLKVKGLLYTEDILEFNQIANDLNSILRSKELEQKEAIFKFRKYIQDKFYIWFYSTVK